MHLAELDLVANTGNSCWHRASPLSKLAFTATTVAVVVLCHSLLCLKFALSLVLVAMLWSGVPLHRLGHFLLVPAVFSAVFALGFTGAGSWRLAVLLKSMTSAGALLLLMSTTPAPAVFAFARWVLPAAVADTLFITYRAFFILLDELSNLITATRLRGNMGVSGLAAALGTLLLRCLERTERMQQILDLRGFQCGMVYTMPTTKLSPHDLVPGAFTIAMALGAWFTWKSW